VNQWNLQLVFKNRIEVFRTANGYQAVGIGELGKDSNVVGIFELCSYVTVVYEKPFFERKNNDESSFKEALE
jgi:hypothetical protein